MSSANRDNFTFSFSIWMLFVSFSYQISLTKISSTTLSKSGKNGHPCPVTDLRGKICNFHHRL